MKILAAIFLAMLAVMPAEAQPQATRVRAQHASAGPHLGGTHFIARRGNGFYRRFHYGNGGVLIFDPPGYSSYCGLPGDDTVYQGQITLQNVEGLPYATPTADPNIVISPYEPHPTISVAGIPHGAQVQDPISNLVFLNP
jgi:hypothetical protein